MSAKYTSSIAGATLLLIIFSVFNKGIGFIREIFIAKFFGAEQDYEVYLIGAILPITINSIIYYIAQNYFIPHYIKIKKDSSGEETLMTSGLFWLYFLVFSSLSLLMLLGADLILSNYTGSLPGELQLLSTEVYRILLISIPLNAGFSILASYMIAEYKYVYPAISQSLSGIIQILFIIIFYNEWKIYAIPAGLIAGYLVQLVYLYFLSRKKINFIFKYLNFKFFRTNEFGSIMIFIIIIETVNQFYVIFDRYFFDQVEYGGIAALNYASTIFLMPLAIVSVALATVIFPKFSEAVGRSNYKELKNYYYKSLIFNLVIYIPIALVMYFFGDLLIKFFFERGKFTPYNTVQTFGVLQIYVISLLFYSSYALIHKVIFSMKLVKHLMIISTFCLITKFLLNALLVQNYEQYGLAMSTSVSYILLSVLGFILVQSKFKSAQSVT
jgi:putative peptidoglycan lipid II flippase